MQRRLSYAALIGAGALVLSACAAPLPAPEAPRPEPAAAPAIPAPVKRSARSEQLAQYYARLQADLLVQGLLRQDGGGPDTPYDSDTLARNFETIAFFNEYAEGALIQSRRRQPSLLSRWVAPIRIGVVFGAATPPAQIETDRSAVSDFAGRLARVTNHPITVSNRNPNFHVLFMGEDDAKDLPATIARLMPEMLPSTRTVLTTLPTSIYCVVVAFADGPDPQVYTRALALIRSEHPDLMRLSCIHEEIAQGLGLANDNPGIRPSIFNDDDEFALLTSHDEKLLTMLYDPRLRPGMTLEEARPLLRTLARDAMGTGR